MNKNVYLFVLILFLTIAHCFYTISAQSGDDNILASGNPPLKQSEMNRIIDFYEWALENDFTVEQRRRFIELSVASYREDVQSSRKGTDDLITVFNKVRSLSENEQQKIRENLKPEMLKEFRRLNDETSRLLLAVAEAKSENQPLAGTVETVNEPAAAPLDENLSILSGKWVWARSGSSTYASGGALLGSNGSRLTYQFSASGAVEYTGIMNVMTAGCRMQVFTSKKGKARLVGDVLTIDWSPAAFSRDDSCSPSKNYKKTLPAETETLRVQLKGSYGQKQLCLSGKEETCFSPEN